MDAFDDPHAVRLRVTEALAKEYFEQQRGRRTQSIASSINGALFVALGTVWATRTSPGSLLIGLAFVFMGIVSCALAAVSYAQYTVVRFFQEYIELRREKQL